ncbi:hypothetical protein [Bosea sp. BIWAKO-01]|uniref:hypothetical protein n=1 Tax=Bosea sp. BIWAKO-01 TaxID=506668 RepID=UPI000853B1B9|nr:hypothetical protein [Bosea sp. BIWAKO-01]GAU86814.1 hypothetical protein BIWAKO_06762 [Bosea sp. BIWAKO-01]
MFARLSNETVPSRAESTLPLLIEIAIKNDKIEETPMGGGLWCATRNRKEVDDEPRDRRGSEILGGQVEYDALMLDFLISMHWLAEVDAAEPGAVGAAGSAMWRGSAGN